MLFIPDPDPDFYPSRIQGSKRHRIPVPQHRSDRKVVAPGASGGRHGGAHQGEHREGAAGPAQGEGEARPGGSQAHRSQDRPKGTVSGEL